MTAVNIIIVFLLFFLPLFVFPFGYSYFEPPKVILAQILIETLLILSLAKKFKLPPPALLIPVVLFFILTFIDLIFMRTETTFWGNIFRFQGIFLLWNLLIFALISSENRLPKIPYPVYLISLAGITFSALILGNNNAGRSLGTLGEPNALSASVIFLLPFIYYFVKNNIIRYTGLVLILWVILLSGSRAGLIAFFIQILFIILAGKFALKKAVLTCLIFLIFSFALPLIEGGGQYENRAEIWQASLAAGFINPVLGGGFGNLEKVLPKGSEIVHNNARFQYVDSSHNFLLDYFVSGGLIGLILILFLLFKTFKNFTFEGKKLELAVLLGLVTVMSFNPVSVVTLVEFWWLIGQGFSDY